MEGVENYPHFHVRLFTMEMQCSNNFLECHICCFTSAPGGPPTSFHILVLNSTSVELQWNLPLANLRNGNIRGFRVFVEGIEDMTDLAIDVNNSEATEYIVNGLQPSTLYTFSVLAYTTSDGPRSIHLTVSTHSAGMYVYFDTIFLLYCQPN